MIRFPQKSPKRYTRHSLSSDLWKVLSWLSLRKQIRWRNLERGLMLTLIFGGFYLYITLPHLEEVEEVDVEYPGLEHDVPIFFSIANKTQQENDEEFPVNVPDDNKLFPDMPKPKTWNVAANALPKLLPKEDFAVQQELPIRPPGKVAATAQPKAAQKAVPKTAPKAVPKAKGAPAKTIAPTKVTPVSKTVDFLKDFRRGKSKVPINSLATEKVSPETWFKKVQVSDTGLDEVTLVTSYLNIGRYKNDDNKFSYSPDTFKRWMTSFCRIQNPVVVFMNDDSDLQLFGNIRSNVPKHRTVMYKVAKSSLWSFSLLPNITKIYKTFPKHNPTTTVPHYTSVAMAKYEFMAIALRENPFKTKYFAWIDIGLFRNLATPVAKIGDPILTLYLPPMLDQKKIAFGQTQDQNEDLKPSEVLRLRKQWISGSIFVGKATVMKKWILQYVKYVKQFLEMGYTGLDQYLVYAMFQTKEELDVTIQTYTWQGHYNPMHHLGFLCRDEGARRNRLSRSKAAAASPKTK